MASYSSTETEIEAVKAIFPDLVEVESSCRICVICASDARVYVTLHPQSIPEFEVCAPSMPSKSKSFLLKKLKDLYAEHPEEPILYSIVETTIELFCEIMRKCEKRDCNLPAETAQSPVSKSLVDTAHQIFSGSILEDRKSIFQGHVAGVCSKEEAMSVLTQLKKKSKIARATHNIYAWRIERTNPNGQKIELHDCECDGEFGAGPKLLKILSMMKVKNLIVIVSRWYGGRHLGPDRFRHICNLAREVILEHAEEIKR